MVGSLDRTDLAGFIDRRHDHAVLACDRLYCWIEAVVAGGVLAQCFTVMHLVQLGVWGEFDVDRLTVDRALELGNNRGSRGSVASGLRVLVVCSISDANEGSSML